MLTNADPTTPSAKTAVEQLHDHVGSSVKQRLLKASISTNTQTPLDTTDAIWPKEFNDQLPTNIPKQPISKL